MSQAVWTRSRRIGAAVSPVARQNLPGPSIGIAGFRWAWVTTALIAVMVAVFWAEHAYPVRPEIRPLMPAAATLAAFGGLSQTLAESGQWYRMLAMPFLHGGLAHLVENMVVMGCAGWQLERYVGRVWMSSIFALGALAGSAGSYLLASNPRIISVGASGAILAMVTAAFMISFRLPPGTTKVRIQSRSLYITLGALLPALHGPGQGPVRIDYGAHLGGAVLGALLGLLLVLAWESDERLPGLRGFASLLAGLAALSFGFAGYEVFQHYEGYKYETNAVSPTLIPVAEVPHSIGEQEARADYLLTAYPQDPRSHAAAAVKKLRQGDFPGAEHESRTALWLAETGPFASNAGPANLIRAGLALIVLQEGRRTEAYFIAANACAATGDAAIPAALKQNLQRAALCGS